VAPPSRESIEVELELPEGRRTLLVTQAARGLSLSDWLRREGEPLNTRCGERGLCQGCVVELVAGRLERIDSGEIHEAGSQPRALHACQNRVTEGSVRLRIPARARLSHRPQVVSEFRLGVARAHDPLAATSQLGVAVDVGTTTVALALVDLADGAVRATVSAFNRQIHLGDDVLTRIQLCLDDPSMLGRLSAALVRDTLAPLLEEALEKTGEPARRIGALSVAGNTTMLHLLASVDPSPMGAVPFAPAFLGHRLLSSRSIGLESFDAPVHLLPGAAAYVGADVCAGILATGLAYDDGPSLLVDAGTNGEIVLRCGGRTSACATAAGPAFEGAGLACGVRAGDGAIEHVRLRGSPLQVECDVIGRGRPAGLCGSAYVEWLAEGRGAGLLTRMGRLDPEAVRTVEGFFLEPEGQGLAVQIASGRGLRPIFVTEHDVATLLQAKAAIAAGILTLLAREGAVPQDVRRLHLAGGFGVRTSVRHAIDCGLLPGFRPEQIEVAGNASLAGAYLALVDRSALTELERVARETQVVELNLDPDFESRYVDNLPLP
jgi:uncharacterized 2Fe-2S/4Fe-4S cluster protein (DUF4445 family)